MRGDSSFVRFWMGHSLGVDAHYITRDVERHRQEYAKGYEYLRIFEPTAISLTELLQVIKQKDAEIKMLRERLEKVEAIAKSQIQLQEAYERLIKIIQEKHPEWITEA
jgi:translation initiation factor 2B subunit (eIF-2B alpha/beta/delta family)